MKEAFLQIVNMSISASWLVIAVLLLRLVLKKMPKWANVLLWGFVAVRLICPVSFESALSLIPSAEPIPEQVITNLVVEVPAERHPGSNCINSPVGGRRWRYAGLYRGQLSAAAAEGGYGRTAGEQHLPE